MSSNVLSCSSREEALENLLLECRAILSEYEHTLFVPKQKILELLAAIDLEVHSGRIGRQSSYQKDSGRLQTSR